MMHATEDNRTIRIYLSGNLNRNNILDIKDDILQRINPRIRVAEFHFRNVEKTDAPAMAIIVSVIKYLLTKEIASKAIGLSGECMELATILGLHTMARVEA